MNIQINLGEILSVIISTIILLALMYTFLIKPIIRKIDNLQSEIEKIKQKLDINDKPE